MDKEEFDSLIRAIIQGEIENVDVSSKGLTLVQVEELAQALMHPNNRVQSLDLTKNNLGAEGVKALVPALQHKHNRIQSLDLSKNNLGAEGVEALVPALQHTYNRIQSLDLSRNNLGAEAISALVPALQHANNSIQHLYLKFNDLEVQDINTLISVLQHENNQICYLTYYPIERSEVGAIESILSEKRAQKKACGILANSILDRVTVDKRALSNTIDTVMEYYNQPVLTPSSYEEEAASKLAFQHDNNSKQYFPVSQAKPLINFINSRRTELLKYYGSSEETRTEELGNLLGSLSCKEVSKMGKLYAIVGIEETVKLSDFFEIHFRDFLQKNIDSTMSIKDYLSLTSISSLNPFVYDAFIYDAVVLLSFPIRFINKISSSAKPGSTFVYEMSDGSKKTFSEAQPLGPMIEAKSEQERLEQAKIFHLGAQLAVESARENLQTEVIKKAFSVLFSEDNFIDVSYCFTQKDILEALRQESTLKSFKTHIDALENLGQIERSDFESILLTNGPNNRRARENIKRFYQQQRELYEKSVVDNEKTIPIEQPMEDSRVPGITPVHFVYKGFTGSQSEPGLTAEKTVSASRKALVF